jgi:hypothetical protein
VKHFASPHFWKLYHQLPSEIQDLADGNFELLKEDSRHPSLHLKKVGRFWSVRVGRKHRAVAIQSDRGLVWFWIGSHAEYDRVIETSP